MASLSDIRTKPVCLVDPLTQSNCYLFTKDHKALIIDPNDENQLLAYLTEHSLTPDLVILTHEHCDHICGLNCLRQHWSMPVAASKLCSDGIQSTKMNMTRIMESYLFFKSQGTLRVSYPKFTCSAAEITFDAPSSDMTWQGHQLRCIAVPGHTPGSICIIWDQSVLFSGDYFIPGEEVITRLPGGDDDAYQRVGKAALRNLPDPIFTYPGHGRPFLLTQEVKRNYGL